MVGAVTDKLQLSMISTDHQDCKVSRHLLHNCLNCDLNCYCLFCLLLFAEVITRHITLIAVGLPWSNHMLGITTVNTLIIVEQPTVLHY